MTTTHNARTTKREEISEKPHHDRADFDGLLGLLATRFINLPADGMDRKIGAGFKLIAEFLAVDRSSLAELTADGSEFVVTHSFCAAGIPPLQSMTVYADAPEYLERLLHGEVISVPDAAGSRCLETGIKSHLALPLQVSGKVIGVFSLDSFQSAGAWPAEMADRLSLLGEILASAIARKNTSMQFHELLHFEKLLSEISSVYANIPAAKVDKTIEYGLQRIGKFLGGDRCNLALFSRNRVRILHSWSDEGVQPLPGFLVGTTNFFPWSVRRLKRGEVFQCSRLEDLPEEAAVDRKTLESLGTKSTLTVPIAVGGPIIGFLAVDTVRVHRMWPEGLIQRLRLVGEIFANAIVRKQKELEIQSAFAEIKKLKDQLEADCTYLREEIELQYNQHNMIGQSEPLKHVIFKIQQIAPTDITVLILGETGTGKELVARAIHAASNRRERPMVKVNCASLPANLIESELFGHEKGAFTSAAARQVGRFELADGNTLFLDEIGELPLESQAKLLRALQEGEFERLGSSRTIKVDVRIIAATNRNLEEEVGKGRFRQDLWYRLNVFPITVPPLRDRREDIPLLANWCVNRFGRKLGKTIKRIPESVMNTLQNYHWPGNVRELENIIERAAVNTEGAALQLLDNLAPPAPTPAIRKNIAPTIEEAERNLIIQVLEQTDWRISGPKGAALILGLNHTTLRYRMQKLGIQIRKSTNLTSKQSRTPSNLFERQD